MESANYLYAGYAALWIIPTIFLLVLVKRIVRTEKKVDEALKKLS